MIYRCTDLETTGVDIDTALVVQAAIVDAVDDAALRDRTKRTEHTSLFAARDVPVGATKVHRITDRNPERFDFPVTVIPRDAPDFAACVLSMVRTLTEPDVVSVSFNGCGYDLPILARYVHALGPSIFNAVLGTERSIAGLRLSPNSREWIELRLRARHIDVMRLWARARALGIDAPWRSECLGVDEGGVQWFVPDLNASMFAGGLTPACGFWLGRGFDSAHDAAVDCHATLDVLHAMLAAGFVTVDTAIKWSNEPLPGDVDFDGKFKWEGDQAVTAFGKHSGTPLEQLPVSYVQWMLNSDFPASTKRLLAEFTKGHYPERMYENEQHIPIDSEDM